MLFNLTIGSQHDLCRHWTLLWVLVLTPNRLRQPNTRGFESDYIAVERQILAHPAKAFEVVTGCYFIAQSDTCVHFE